MNKLTIIPITIFLASSNAHFANANALEDLLTPEKFSIDKYYVWNDLGGLNTKDHSTVYGVSVSGLQIQPKGGKLNSVELRVNWLIPVKEIRDAMEKLCNVSGTPWTITRNGDYQAGSVSGEVCRINYMPYNDVSWSVLIEYGKEESN